MWLDDDRDKVAAWAAEKAEVCPDCGTTESDWVDDSGRYRLDPTWEATAVRCYGCQAIANVAADIPDGQRGVRIALRPAGPFTIRIGKETDGRQHQHFGVRPQRVPPAAAGR